MPPLKSGMGGRAGHGNPKVTSQGEFPPGASSWPESLSRRRFLEMMGASMALAGAQACSTRQPPETILPYARAPERLLPGRPQYYATSMDLGGDSIGLLVKSDMGRPIKVEGNPDHPASLGASDAFAQASLLGLYDPARSRTVLLAGRTSTWEAFTGELETARRGWADRNGQGLRILTGNISSPSLMGSLESFLKQYPETRWHAWEPMDSGNAAEGARLAFGRRLRPIHRLDRARVIVSLDADFLDWAPERIRCGRDFAAGRRPDSPEPMNRLYMVETCASLTGANADHRLALPPSQLPAFVRLLAREIGLGAGEEGNAVPPEGPVQERLQAWARGMAADLDANRGTGLIMAGEPQPPWVHAMAHAMNDRLGNTGHTVRFVEPGAGSPARSPASLSSLAEDMRGDRVETLLILDGNPAYTSPADVGFAEALARVANPIHCGLYADETASRCRWHIPAAHYLESWGDGRAYEGTVSLVQPLIEPLYFGRTPLEMIAALAGNPGARGYDMLRDYWRERKPGPGFQAFWSRALELGFLERSAFPEAEARLAPGLDTIISRLPKATPAGAGGLQVVFRPDATVWDGRFSENAWLQELPKPLTKLTWDNAIHVSPATASTLGAVNGDEVELEWRGRKLTGPIWTVPGHADGSLTLTFGYGRARAGAVAADRGYNAYALRTLEDPWHGSGIILRKTGGLRNMACTQNHQSLEGRDLVKRTTRERFLSRPRTPIETGNPPPSLYPKADRTGYAWGMTVDLSLCTGCSACVIACQAENNIPVVGKEQVARGREMHWLRIDLYFQSLPGDSSVLFQPLLCMHCENAPCELVCPVEATVHSAEGLNEMIYNRCIGTRYCSNNCPYKVRRFNFFQYNDRGTESLKAMRNPDVTVRTRGVMEKCTYCVQRIERARIGAEMESRAIRDGEIVTACQQACPAGAILFGDLNDAGSRVAGSARGPRDYHLLRELNTRPRTTYLSKVTNPNPGFAGDAFA